MSLLAAAVGGLLAVLGLAAIGVSQLVGARLQAQTAADAAALAAASATYVERYPVTVAHDLARANGADLVLCVCAFDPAPQPRQVEVRVVVSERVPFFGTMDVYAGARAIFEPPSPPPDP